MAQTITLRAHGNADFREAGRRLPASSRDSRYFISPAWPAAIHSGKWASSGNSWTEEMPARSNPTARAECLMKSEIWVASRKHLLSRDRAGQRLRSYERKRARLGLRPFGMTKD